jgi:4'-phosphopantetheinyl transferase
MKVYWLEQTEADVPATNDWLSASEVGRLNGMRFAKRRADWRLGRWTAKRALALHSNAPGDLRVLGGIEIRPSASGAPEAFFAEEPSPLTMSLSHRGGVALCGIAPSGAALGCDLEMIEPRSDAFVADYFTTEEQALIARVSAAGRAQLVALLWSGKESALKALRTGLRLSTQCVAVSPREALPHRSEWEEGYNEHPAFDVQMAEGADSWRPLQVGCTDGQVFHGWWQHSGSLVRTIVAAPPPDRPVLLGIPACFGRTRAEPSRLL